MNLEFCCLRVRERRIMPYKLFAEVQKINPLVYQFMENNNNKKEIIEKKKN
jgi:hypothetical protein